MNAVSHHLRGISKVWQLGSTIRSGDSSARGPTHRLSSCSALSGGMKTFRIAVLVAVIAASVLSSAQHGAAKLLDSAIDQIMQARSAAGDFSGAVLIARQGHILYERAFALANLEWQIPNDLQTKFEIGSMTKQFTALLILQFVNEGRVHLDGHISDCAQRTNRSSGEHRQSEAFGHCVTGQGCFGEQSRSLNCRSSFPLPVVPRCPQAAFGCCQRFQYHLRASFLSFPF